MTTVTQPADRILGALGRPIVPLVATVIAFAIGFGQKLPCYAVSWREQPTRFNQYCYSDIPVLFRQRGIVTGIFPYASNAWKHPLEYPVVIGFLMDATGRMTRLIGRGGDLAAATRMYFVINTVLLLGCALVMVWVTWVLLQQAGTPAAALLVALAPSLALAGTINWDLAATALSLLALLAWTRDRPAIAGVLIGLGTAAKLYPVLLLAALFGLCLRQRRMRAFLRASWTATLAWAVVNLPIALLYPDGWLEFWKFNAERHADYGSIWHGLASMGYRVAGLNMLTTGLLVLLWVGVVALALWAPRPPTAAQLTFLTVAAFLVTNKVYSPQYVLWLLPLVVLARASLPPRQVLPAWLVWQAAEMTYWVAIWRFFIHHPQSEGWQYPAAIFVRVAVTVWLAVLVIRDCLRQEPAGRPAEPLGVDQPPWTPIVVTEV